MANGYSKQIQKQIKAADFGRAILSTSPYF